MKKLMTTLAAICLFAGLSSAQQASDLEGSWTFSAEEDGETTVFGLSFAADNTYEMTWDYGEGVDETETGTFEANGPALTLTSGADVSYVKIMAFSATELSLDLGGGPMVFTKVE